MPYKQGKKWRGVIKINGRRVAQKLFKSKQEAKKWEIEEKKRLETQTHMAYLLEVATGYLDYCKERFTKNTYGDKRKVLSDLIKATGDVALNEITPNEILQLLRSKATRNLFNRTRKDLHSFFEYCKKFHGLVQNPVSAIEKLPTERLPQPVPTEKEFVKLLLVANRHDRNLLIACCTTGGRRSEIFRWKWSDDINFEKRKVRLGSRKTRSGEMRYRDIDMNDMLNEALQDQWKTRLPQSDYVFQNRDPRHPRYGDRYTARRKFMRGLCKRAGVRTFGFHALRRFFASLLADKYKESLPVIQKLLGHASATTTDKYIYNISEDSKKAVNKIRFDIKVPHSVPQKIGGG